MRLYKSREGARKRLKKMGIPDPLHKYFISYSVAGYVLMEERLDDYLKKIAQALEMGGSLPPPPEYIGTLKRRSKTDVIRKLVHKGLTNAEIWPIVQIIYDLPPEKKLWISWVRSEMRRDGEIPQSTRLRKTHVIALTEEV